MRWKRNLVFNVIRYDDNKHDITIYNVLGDRYRDLICNKIKKGIIKNRDELKEDLRTYLFYYYGSRAEYEMSIGSLHVRGDDYKRYYDESVKVDIYTQAVCNLDVITDYVIHTLEIKFEG